VLPAIIVTQTLVELVSELSSGADRTEDWEGRVHVTLSPRAGCGH
jgi:hypothetical protein